MSSKITFTNNLNQKLSGIVTKVGESKEKIVLFIHGYGSSKESETYTTLSNLLEKENIPSFRFDLTGHGESEGKFEDVTITQAIEDTKSAIKILKTLGYKKIIIMASSLGGYLATYTAPTEKSIIKLILRAPVLDFYKLLKLRTQKFSSEELERFKKQGYFYYQPERKFYWKFYQDILKNKYDAKKGILKCKIPIIVIHGDADKIVPFSLSENICSKITNCKLIKIKGGNHRLNSENIKLKVIKIIVEEIKKTFNNK